MYMFPMDEFLLHDGRGGIVKIHIEGYGMDIAVLNWYLHLKLDIIKREVTISFSPTFST